ncbi:MAG: efflux RND transporter permease subunit [Gammaproteobacteria bacterium]
MSFAPNFMRRYLTWVVSHRLLVILVITACTLWLAFQAKDMELENDRDLWLPHGHPYVESSRLIQDVFGGRNVIVIGVYPKHGDIYQPRVLEKITRIQKNITRIPEAVKHNVLSLAARKVKAINGTQEGMVVHPMLERIPSTEEEIGRLKEDVVSNPFFIKTLVAEDGTAAAIIADFKINEDIPRYTELYESITTVIDDERDDSVTFHVGGAPVQYALVEHYTTEAPRYFGISFLIIMLIQYWSFRSFQGMLLPMLTASLSVVWGRGIMGLAGVNLDVLNSVTPILIMAVTAGHAIQILKRYYEEYQRLAEQSAGSVLPRELNRVAVIDSLVRIGPVMIAAGVISGITFFSLTAGGTTMIRHFGLFAGSGILSALILEMSFVPALRSLLPAPPLRASAIRRQRSLVDTWLSVLSDRVAQGRAPWILAGGLLLIVVTAAGTLRLQVDSSTLRYLAPTNQVRVDDTQINRTFGGTNTIYFLVEGQGQDSLKDPEVLRGMERLQVFLEQQRGVGKTQSLADLIKRMNQAMHNDDPAYFMIPNSRELVAQYLLLYTVSGEPQDFDNFVDNDYQKAVVWVFLKEDSTAFAEELYEMAKPLIARYFPPGVKIRIGGSVPETIAMNEVVVKEKLMNILQMAIVIFLLSSLILRSFVGGLFVVAPVLLIVLANFGAMGWFGIPLDMGTATTASIAISVGADYEIYLLYRFKEEFARTRDLQAATEASLLTAGKAVLFVALSIAGGYAVLLTSDFGFYSQLSLAVIMTMLISAVSTLLLLRSMMVVFKPRFVFGA